MFRIEVREFKSKGAPTHTITENQLANITCDKLGQYSMNFKTREDLMEIINEISQDIEANFKDEEQSLVLFFTVIE